MDDLNARLPDLDLFDMPGVEYSDKDMENHDKDTNQNGHDLMSIYKNFNLVPINHRNTPNCLSEGGLTFRHGQVCVSQLEWVCCSSTFANASQSFVIHPGGFPQSNHAPLSNVVLTPSGDEAEQIYKHACDSSSLFDSQYKPFRRSKQFSSLDLDHLLCLILTF